jgi:hypothetical protein
VSASIPIAWDGQTTVFTSCRNILSVYNNFKAFSLPVYQMCQHSIQTTLSKGYIKNEKFKV